MFHIGHAMFANIDRMSMKFTSLSIVLYAILHIIYNILIKAKYNRKNDQKECLRCSLVLDNQHPNLLLVVNMLASSRKCWLTATIIFAIIDCILFSFSMDQDNLEPCFYSFFFYIIAFSIRSTSYLFGFNVFISWIYLIYTCVTVSFNFSSLFRIIKGVFLCSMLWVKLLQELDVIVVHNQGRAGP